MESTNLKEKIGIILAGGKSSRMKQDKSELVIENKTLLERQMNCLENLVSEENIFLAGYKKNKSNKSQIPPSIQCVQDLVIGRGPLEGLRSALKILEQKFGQSYQVWVIPVDMPLLKAETLQKLKISTQADVSHFADQELPLFILNPKNVLNQIEKMFVETKEDRRYSIRSLLQCVRTEKIPAENLIQDFFNTNTREEWQQVLEILNKKDS